LLKHFLLERWKEFVGTPVPSSMDLVTITSCTEDYGNNVILVFTNSDKNPSHVIKVCRNPAYGFKLKREYEALRALSNTEELKPYIPTPYILGEYDGCTFFIQAGVPGLSLFKLITEHGMNKTNCALIEQAIDLLVDINGSTVNVDSKDVLWGGSAQDMLSRFESEFFNIGLKRAKITELKEMYKNAADEKLRLFTHGDYWQSNIIIDERKKKVTGIIDWEFCSPGSSVPTDIIWFLINLAYCLYVKMNRAATVFDSYNWGFFDPGKHNEAFAIYYRRYMSGIGLNSRMFKLLLEISLAEMSMRELATYGRHSDMDRVCMDMLMYTVENEQRICIC
jgi:aminoglycoside phosphotransferase (APT) family kinase protein